MASNRQIESSESSFVAWYADSLAKNAESICQSWLERLLELVPEEARDVFPTETLLDHVPKVIRGLARDVAAPMTEDVVVSSAVTEKARELGDLRFSQRSSVHQIIREYSILAELLAEFLKASIREAGSVDPIAVAHVGERVSHGIRVLMQASVDSFSERYTATIARQREQLESFNRMISHELRNPVNTLELSVDLLTEENMTSEGVEKVGALLRRSVDRITHLIRSLEALATVDEDPDGPTRQKLELSGIANDVVSQLSDMAEARRVEVRVDDNLPRVVGDPHRIEMILLNLMANGIKYSDPEKMPRFVAVEFLGAESSSQTIRLRVRDNGIGIPKEMQEAVFGRFFRAHREQDSELGVRGSGLGLSIVSDCVRTLGGSVELESSEGEGTAITVSFEVQEAPSP